MSLAIDSPNITFHPIDRVAWSTKVRGSPPSIPRTDTQNGEVFTKGLVTGISGEPAKLVNIIAHATRSYAGPNTFTLEKSAFATSRPRVPEYMDLALYYPLALTATLLVMQKVQSRSLRSASSARPSKVQSICHSAVNGDCPRRKRRRVENSSPSYENLNPCVMTADSSHSYDSSLHSRSLGECIENVDPCSQQSLFANYCEFPPSLPVICVAEQPVIISLLRSAVYQRLAWGFSDPVTGLTFSPTSPMVQLLLAWPDTETSTDGLPLVIIASDQSQRRGPTVGWFDLRHHSAVLALERYLSGVIKRSRRFHPVASTRSTNGRWPEWRFDFVKSRTPENMSVDKTAFVQAWVENVVAGGIPAGVSDSSSNREPGWVLRGKTQRFTHWHLISGVLNIDEPLEAMIRWLWDRMTPLHSLLPLANMSAPPAYISLTRFAWHVDWDDLDPLPKVQNAYRSLRTELLLAKESYCNAHDRHPLSGPVAAELRANLEFILAACAQAKYQHEDAAEKGTHIACDHVWGALIVKLLHDKTFQARHSTAIALPRSRMADQYEKPEWYFCAKYTMRQHYSYTAEHRGAARTAPYAQSALETQAFEAMAMLTQFPKFDPSADDYQAVLNRVSRDPVETVCDVVVTVSLPGFVDSNASPALQHATQTFSLVPTNPAPATVIARGGTPFYHGICDLPSAHEGLATAYDLFCANIPSSGLVTGEDDFLDLDMLSSPPIITTSSLPDSNLEDKDVPCPACAPPLAQSVESSAERGSAASYCTPASEDPLPRDLPLLFVNHTPPEKVLSYVGSHKHRLSATAGAAFLGAAGLHKVPVFSLVTDSCRGVITCAWSEAFGGFQRTKIAERNGVLFDLRSPLSVFHFATFLVRLKYEHGRMLRERFDGQALAHLRERLERGEWETRWTMSHYTEEQEKTRSEIDSEDVV